MPIFMDRHDVSEAVTAEIVADLHQKDLKIQHKFDCKGLTYWFDDIRKTAFCLVEAPNKEAIQKMHDHAHGVVAHRIIEVDSAVVESFLGRIEDPKKSQKTALNIINDPAFRIIMIAETRCLSLKKGSDKETKVAERLNEIIVNYAHQYKGRIVKQKNDYFLLSFDSVTKAVLCALKIHGTFQEKLQRVSNPVVKLKIGLCAGIPISEKDEIFEDTIQMAERLCRFVKGGIVVTSEVGELYESENLNIAIDNDYVKKLCPADEKFLKHLIDFLEKEWNNPTLNIDGFGKSLGFSISQLYRKIIALIGISPNNVLRAYRLQKALELLDKHNGNVSEVAYKTGFNSPAYFSKCFQESFGILPSTYLKSRHS